MIRYSLCEHNKNKFKGQKAEEILVLLTWPKMKSKYEKYKRISLEPLIYFHLIVLIYFKFLYIRI